MSEKSVAFEYCDKMVEDFEKVIEHLFAKNLLCTIPESIWEPRV